MDTNYFRLVDDNGGRVEVLSKGSEEACRKEADRLLDNEEYDELILEQLVLDDGLKGDFWMEVCFLYADERPD